MQGEVVDRVRGAVHAACAEAPRLLLAVSGGRDSMALLDAALAVLPHDRLSVGTFDHGTGAAAAAAVRHVRAAARGAGVPVTAGRAVDAPCGPATAATEDAWRTARWRFLRRAARRVGREDDAPATIATAHTRDDQLETVVMRVLRDAGARGLAAMYAPTPGVVRPLLGCSAADVRAYAEARGLAWVDDPSNTVRRHLRNRVRIELLPALAAATPALAGELLALARRAAAWRAEVDAWADALAQAALAPAAPVRVRLRDLAGYGLDALAVLWLSLAARADVRLDRRGTARLAAFTVRCAARWAARSPAPARATVAGAVVACERVAPGSSEWVMALRPAPRSVSR